MLHNQKRFAGKYTEEQRRDVVDYLNAQLDKVELDNITKEEHDYMLEMMLIMYSNPLKNKLKTLLGGME